jgi:hypothetical protein
VDLHDAVGHRDLCDLTDDGRSTDLQMLRVWPCGIISQPDFSATARAPLCGEDACPNAFSELERILPGDRCQFVDEPLDD